MITEYIFKKLLDAALDKGKKTLANSERSLVTVRKDMEEAISRHLISVKNWASEISFADLHKAKDTKKVFIQLDLFVYPRRKKFSVTAPIKSIPLKSIFKSKKRHFIILGPPGAGKTTSMKFICHKVIFDGRFYSKRISFPILIKFRDLNSVAENSPSSLVIDRIYNILGLVIDFPPELSLAETVEGREYLKKMVVLNVLDELKVLLVLEGLDELGSAERREDVLEEIRDLALNLEQATIVLTSRTGDFVYSIDNTAEFEISPLTPQQISKFSNKWLANKQVASEFLTQVNSSPFYDTTIRPLILAHLCAIFEREGRIPAKPKTVYRKIVNLQLEEWDLQRSVSRVSKYAKFEPDRKFEFLSDLAYKLTISKGGAIFSRDDLLRVYKEIYDDYGLKYNEAKQVATEIETHNGLLLQTSYTEFEFAHKSLQEYLAAEYLVRLPSIPSEPSELFKLPNELAIAVSISSKPSVYFTELVLQRLLHNDLNSAFLHTFLNRLISEKPDFSKSVRLGFAVLALHSAIMAAGQGLRGRLGRMMERGSAAETVSDYDADELFGMSYSMSSTFKVLYQLIPLEETLETIGTCYKYDGQTSLLIGGWVDMFLKQKDIEQLDLFNLPESLLILPDLVSPPRRA
ncbi:MAG: NACHT domain-containing protein [Acidobacteria bacterium]|nr:NACHT domain-containing protein [Acidobacteriota bacterium]